MNIKRLHWILTPYMNAAGADGADGGGGKEGDKPMTQAEIDKQIAEQVESNPRVTAMDAIAARNDGQVVDELRAAGADIPAITPAPPPPTETPAPTPAPAAATPAPTAAPAAAAIDEQVLAQLGKQTVRVEALDNVRISMKVDGKDWEGTIFELRRMGQLDGAAQSRLARANELLEQAERVRAAANGAPAPGPAAPPAGDDGKTGGGDSAPKSKDVTEEATRLANALLGGDEEAVTEALKKILQGAQPTQQIDTSTLVSQLVPKVKQQLSVEDATRKFASEFKDIVGDPYLASVADGHLGDVLKEEPQKPFDEALQEAGKRTRDWLASKGVKPASSPAPTPARDTKLERKEGIDNVAGLSTKATPPEVKEQTASDVISEMRAARGLAA